MLNSFVSSFANLFFLRFNLLYELCLLPRVKRKKWKITNVQISLRASINQQY